MNLFVRLAAVVSFSSSASLSAQSPRLALDLGAGGSTTYGGDFRGSGGTVLNASGTVRVAQLAGMGIQVVAASTHTFFSGDYTLICLPTPRGDCSPSGLTGTQYTAGLGVEKLVAPILSIRVAASAGWFQGAKTSGAGAHAYPVLVQFTVPITDHFGLTATASRTALRDLGGDNLHVNMLWAGVRFN